MKLIGSASFVMASSFLLGSPALGADPTRINAYVRPYYDSSGPVVKVGKYSSGLASKIPGTFVATILRTKKQWNDLNFVELYVAAIRLYDLGYRREATYWFYSAQYRGRQFGLLVDQKKMGSIGDRGFELYHAQNAFFELTGPDINGYAFGDIEWLVPIIRRVQSENQAVSNLNATYPGVTFVPHSQWQRINATLNSGLGQLAVQLWNQKDEIKQQRLKNGTAARYALTSKPFPGGL